VELFISGFVEKNFAVAVIEHRERERERERESQGGKSVEADDKRAKPRNMILEIPKVDDEIEEWVGTNVWSADAKAIYFAHALI
jgi:hypothetical protein